jgi:hypothetical protein
MKISQHARSRVKEEDLETMWYVFDSNQIHEEVLNEKKRIFSHTDRIGWILNGLALIGAVGAGSALPLIDILFGQFVTAFNGLATGSKSPTEFRSDLSKFSYVGLVLSLDAL